MIRCHNQKGFSVTEVLVALVIIALALLPFLTVLSFSNRVMKEKAMHQQALFLAQGKLEELKGCSLPDLVDVPENNYPGHSGFSFAVDTQSVNPALKRINVRVSFTVAGEETTVRLTGFKAKR